MRRFFVGKEDIDEIEGLIFIKGSDYKHIKDVLRLRQGDVFEVSSDAMTYSCKLEDFEDQQLIAKIISAEEGRNEAPIDLVLYQALAKGSKMDLIFQKATEIGVKDFYAFSSNRTVVKLDGKKAKKRLDRWNSIAYEASKQSKRDYIPQLKGILSYKEILANLKDKTNVILAYEDEEGLSLGAALKDIEPGPIHLVIGPEGGFDYEEIEDFKSQGAKIVSLGPRILRTETAGLVAATIVLYQLGDLGVD